MTSTKISILETPSPFIQGLLPCSPFYSTLPLFFVSNKWTLLFLIVEQFCKFLKSTFMVLSWILSKFRAWLPDSDIGPGIIAVKVIPVCFLKSCQSGLSLNDVSRISTPSWNADVVFRYNFAASMQSWQQTIRIVTRFYFLFLVLLFLHLSVKNTA